MSKIANPYKCDVCGQPKGEGNKWLLGIPIIDGCPLPCHAIRKGFEPPTVKSAYILMDWDDEIVGTEETIHHLCSEKCALTKQAEYLRRT